jgi:pilus assembly protein Flp/PilA
MSKNSTNSKLVETMALMRRLVGEDEKGATAIEYALVACGISVAIVAAVASLGSKTNQLFASVAAVFN